MKQISLPGLRRAAVCTGVLAVTLAACVGCKATATVASGGSTVSASGAVNAGSGGGAASPSPGTSQTAAGNGSGAVSGTGNTGSSGSGDTGSSGGTGQTCLTQNLSVTTGGDNPGAGKDNLNLVFKNIGDTTCTLYGYPGVSLGAGSPDRQVGQPASRVALSGPSTVSLAPGAQAYAPLTVADALNFPTSSCNPTTTTELRVYPPANTTLLYVSYQSRACTSATVTLQIGPVQPGSGS